MLVLLCGVTVCDGIDGVNYEVWRAAPRQGVPLWHGYDNLGYEVEGPSPVRLGALAPASRAALPRRVSARFAVGTRRPFERDRGWG